MTSFSWMVLEGRYGSVEADQADAERGRYEKSRMVSWVLRGKEKTARVDGAIYLLLCRQVWWPEE